jgi:hypothetical protein
MSDNRVMAGMEVVDAIPLAKDSHGVCQRRVGVTFGIDRHAGFQMRSPVGIRGGQLYLREI